MDSSSLMQAPITAQFTNTDPSPAPQTHSASGFLGDIERNAQTIGSVAGGVFGTLVDPFGGSIAGSAIGGALGQWLKNETTGTDTNPLEEGAISGGLDLAGQGISKVASPLLSKAGQVADKYGINLLSQVGGAVDRKTAKAFGAGATTKLMSDLGIDPAKYADTSQKVMNVLHPLVNKGIGNAGNVDTTGLDTMADDLINKETGIGGMAADKGSSGYKLSQSIKSDLEKLKGTSNAVGAPLTKTSAPGDILAPSANPLDVNDYISKLRDDVATLIGKGKNPLSITDAARSEAGVKATLADELEDRLYEGDKSLPDGTVVKGANANKAVVSGLVDKGSLDKLSSILPDTPRSKQLIAAIGNAKTIGEVRSAMAPFYNASKLAAAKEAEAGTAGAASRSITQKPVELATGIGGLAAAPFTGGLSAVIPAAELALNTDTGKTIVGNAARKIGQKLLPDDLKAGAQSMRVGANMTLPPIEQATKKSAADIIKSIPKMTTVKAIEQTLPRTAAAITSSGNTNTPGSPPTSVSDIVSTAVDEAMSSMPSTSSVSNSGNGVLSATNYQQLESQYGNQGINAYMNYMKMTQPELSSEQQTNWVQGQTLLSRLKQVAQLYSQSNAGPLTGRLSELSGAFGSKSGAAAQSYDAQRDELATTLVRFVNEGGRSGGSSMTQMLRQELPTLGDSSQTASTKFAALVQAVVMQMQNNLAGPATNTPGQLTSFSGSQPAGGSAGVPSQASDNILNFMPPSSVSGF